MSKKTATAVATAILGIVVTMSTAIALNIGILDRTANDDPADTEAIGVAEASPAVGTEPPLEPTPDPTSTPAGLNLFPNGIEVVTVYVDDPAPAALPAAPAAVPVSPTAPPAPPAVATRTPVPPSPTATPVSASPTATPESTVSYPVYDVGAAGRVALVFDGSTIGFWGAYPNGGWQYVVDESGPREVEVEFARFDEDGEDIAELEFKAKLEGSTIKIEMEEDD